MIVYSFQIRQKDTRVEIQDIKKEERELDTIPKTMQEKLQSQNNALLLGYIGEQDEYKYMICISPNPNILGAFWDGVNLYGHLSADINYMQTIDENLPRKPIS
jgi:hypothetical protein